MGRRSRWGYLREIYARYQKASRKEKSRTLTEFCTVARYNRKYALRLLNGEPPKRVPPEKRKRQPKYSRGVEEVLRVIWEAANYPWSLRLRALIPLWLPWVKKHKEVSPRLEKELLTISPRQIDRRLALPPVPIIRGTKQSISPGQLTIHADRGSAMTSKTVALLFSDLDILRSHSRPYVSSTG